MSGYRPNTDDHEGRLLQEIDQLVLDIRRIGPTYPSPQPRVLFGELFDDDAVQQYYEALVGTLKSAKKRGIVQFKGQILLKGMHDAVVISIVDESPPPPLKGLVEDGNKAEAATPAAKKSVTKPPQRLSDLDRSKTVAVTPSVDAGARENAAALPIPTTTNAIIASNPHRKTVASHPPGQWGSQTSKPVRRWGSTRTLGPSSRTTTPAASASMTAGGRGGNSDNASKMTPTASSNKAAAAPPPPQTRSFDEGDDVAQQQRPPQAAPPPSSAAATSSSIARPQLIVRRTSSAISSEVNERVTSEIARLPADITRICPEGEPWCLFGDLFDDDDVQQHYEALVGTLKSAKKRGVIKFKGQMLLKGMHDGVRIEVVQDGGGGGKGGGGGSAKPSEATAATSASPLTNDAAAISGGEVTQEV